MPETFGVNFSKFRKEKGLTQEDIAKKLSISPQAISKWENDLSYPDISLLGDIAEMFNVTIDELLGKTKKQAVYVEEEKRDISTMILKINVVSVEGDKVRVNLPLGIVKVMLNSGAIPSVNGIDINKTVDFNQIFALVEKGVLGKLVEVESSEGDIVEIWVE